MTARSPRVCPACRRPARNRPLPPAGFWQEQVLQRLGMYPYRCEDCGVRFYRKVPVGDGLGEARYAVPNRKPPLSRNPAPPEAPGDALSHEEFVDLIDHISRADPAKGRDAAEKKDEKR